MEQVRGRRGAGSRPNGRPWAGGAHLRAVQRCPRVPQLRLQAFGLFRRLYAAQSVGVADVRRGRLQRCHAAFEGRAVGLGSRQQRVRRRRQAPRVLCAADLRR